ncbi:MAG: hypothetical protein K8S97_00980 [Anaerolineae bacterium]|nr:hypothetical protein [Anaerolineae bacterium]
MINVILIGSVCALIVLGMWRGYRKERAIDQPTVVTWLLFILIAITLVLRNDPFETWVNQPFGDLEVSYTLSQHCLLGGIVLYSVSLKRLLEASAPAYPIRPYHTRFNTAMVIISVVLVGVMMVPQTGMLTPLQSRYLVRLVADSYVALQMGVVLIPINLWLLRQEQVGPMRAKHRAVVVLCGITILNTLAAWIIIPVSWHAATINPALHAVPRGPVSIACLLVILMPHRWLVRLGMPLQWCLYYRLCALEQQLADRVTLARERLQWRHMLQPDEVEMAIYLVVINILDHYRRVDPDDVGGQKLLRQIDAVWSQNPRYGALVHAMSKVQR